MKSLIIRLAIVSASILSFGFLAWKIDWSGKKVNEGDEIVKNYNYVIGTQTVGSKYQFTDETMLVETAQQIKDMGSNLLKFSMHPRYCTENYGLPENEEINSLKELAILEPSVKAVLDMDFKYYHIWAYGFSQYSGEPEGKKDDTAQIKFIGGYDDSYANALYQEMYELVVHLLTTYSNTGKVFYLGHWEGDWHLRWDYDRTKAVDMATLEGITKWEMVRQQAVDDAKRDTEYSGVELYNYIEVNLIKVALEDNKKVLTNSVLHKVNPDYVSYSSYDATNPSKSKEELKESLHEALDYIESFLPPKEGLPTGKRVWIGEYGTPAIHAGEQVQDERSKWTIKAGLEWGAPYILYWEMYNNEIHKKSGKQVGYWLIDDKAEKQAIWHTHNKFYEEGRAFVKDYYQKHQSAPTFEEFQEATRSFKSLETSPSISVVEKEK